LFLMRNLSYTALFSKRRSKARASADTSPRTAHSFPSLSQPPRKLRLCPCVHASCGRRVEARARSPTCSFSRTFYKNSLQPDEMSARLLLHAGLRSTCNSSARPRKLRRPRPLLSPPPGAMGQKTEANVAIFPPKPPAVPRPFALDRAPLARFHKLLRTCSYVSSAAVRRGAPLLG
jgi:hypothetical protein